jgi:hypothetical protein
MKLSLISNNYDSPENPFADAYLLDAYSNAVAGVV